MLSVKVGGAWLSTIGAYSPVTVEFGLHGSEAASWEMSPKLRHPLLRGNKTVQVFDGGVPIWLGDLIEPGSDGQYVAKGAWHQAETAPTINSAGDPTTWPNDSIAQAFARGDITWSGTVKPTDGAFGADTGELNLAELLNGVTAELGTRWSVSPTGVCSASVDPTTPMWHVPHAVSGRGLTPAEDEFASHLVGRFLVSAGVFDFETVGSADAAAVFGRRPVQVDLVPLGFITSTRANSILTGMFLRAGARMGWAEGLDLAHGQITTPGGIASALAQVQAGQMIRLCGTVDTSRAYAMPGYTDLVIATSRYTDGTGRIQLTPLGYAARNMREVLDMSLVIP